MSKEILRQYCILADGYIQYSEGNMREFFIAFRSRSDAMRFYEELTTYRIPARIINTPSSAGVGCGLSVKLLAKNLQQAKIVLERSRLASAIGFFYFAENGSARRMNA